MLMGVEIIDFISEAIIISLLSSVKSEYDAEFRMIRDDIKETFRDHAMINEELVT